MPFLCFHLVMNRYIYLCLFFFFQAEDGIRDLTVTGVQTCALPISILLSVDTVFNHFRASFVGKSSPVHFFWGSFDLAVTRFSGRRAPERPGADAMTREAYSHEGSSVGFWPGGGSVEGAAVYSYAAPEPQGFKDKPVRPNAAFYDRQLGEFLLMYDDVRKAESPTASNR